MGRDALNNLGGTNIFSPLGGQDQTPQQAPLGPPSSATAIPNTPNGRVVSAQPNSPADVPTGTPMPQGQNITGPNTTVTGVDYGPVQTNGGGQMPPQGQPQQPPMQAQPQQSQQQPQQQPFQTAQSGGQPRMDEATAQMYDKRAADAAKYATAISFSNPGAAAQLKSLSEQWSKQSQIIRGALAKNAETTSAEKDMSSGVTQKGEILKGDVTRGQTAYAGIQAAATQYERDTKPLNDITRPILSDPRFVSGFAGDLSLTFNKIRAQLGDKQAAVYQEAVSKITATNILSQINQQKAQLQEAGSGTSRLFSQQIGLMMKAAQSLENTVAGNRFLLNVSDRSGKFSADVAQQARDYKAKHGYLDAGFDQHMTNYVKQNPVFSTQEIKNPHLLSAPDAPANNTDQWAAQMGLSPGDPVRLPSGRYVPVPGPH